MRLYISATVLPTIIFFFVACTASPDTRPLDEAVPEPVDEAGDSAQATVVTSADTIIRLDPNAEDLARTICETLGKSLDDVDVSSLKPEYVDIPDKNFTGPF